MKKISSKIIISILLAIFLFSGVNFDFGKTASRPSLGVEKAYAAMTAEQRRATCLGGGYTEGTPEYRQCITRLIDNDYHLGFKDKLVLKIDKGVQAVKDWAGNTATRILGAILYVILSFINWLVSLSGSLFDVAINYSILKISTYTDILSSINTVWVVVRDILNIAFIFVLLWVAIKTIIGLSGASTKKMIASVIISALLINFSLFITRVIIDAGNIVAVNLYERVLVDVKADGEGKKYISSAIMDNSGLSVLYKPTEVFKDDAQNVQSIIYLLVKIILASVMAWAFFFASFLFVGRIIAFIILMAFSPIGFVGEIIPYLKPQSKQWWDTLINQTLVAPLFLLFMFIIIKVSSSGSFVIDSANLSTLPVSLYFNIALIVALLIVAVKTTKKLSGEVGGMMTNFGAAALGMGLGLASGGTASLLRRTIGKKALADVNNEELKERASKGDLRAQMQLAVASRVAKGSFDVRSTKAAGNLAKKAGIDMNKGLDVQKGGYAQTIKDAEKKAGEEAKYMTEGIKANLPAERDRIAQELREKTEEYDRLTAMPLPTDPAKLAAHQAKMDEVDKEHKELTRQSKLSDEELKKEAVKRDKDARLENMAITEDRKNKIFGINMPGKTEAKVRAEALRKAKKGKSDEETIAEAVQRMADKKAKEKASETGEVKEEGKTKEPEPKPKPPVAPTP